MAGRSGEWSLVDRGEWSPQPPEHTKHATVIKIRYQRLTWAGAKLLTGPEEDGALREETEAFCLGSAFGGGRALVGRLGVTGAGVVGENCWNVCCC